MEDERIFEALESGTISERVEYLDYEPNIIEQNEIEQLSHVFPNIQQITISAENVFETKLDLKGFKKLREITLIVLASNDYNGEIDDEETQPELQFKLLLHDWQVPNIAKFVIRTEELEGQDLNYMLDKFGSRFQFDYIKIFCGNIMIN